MYRSELGRWVARAVTPGAAWAPTLKPLRLMGGRASKLSGREGEQMPLVAGAKRFGGRANAVSRRGKEVWRAGGFLTSSHHLAILSSCQLITSSDRHIIFSSSCHLIILSSCHTITSSSHHLAILSSCHIITSSSHHLVILSSCPRDVQLRQESSCTGWSWGGGLREL